MLYLCAYGDNITTGVYHLRRQRHAELSVTTNTSAIEGTATFRQGYSGINGTLLNTCNDLILGSIDNANAGASGFYQLYNGNLNCGTEAIDGNWGGAASGILQFGGTNTIIGALLVGSYSSLVNAHYELEGGSLNTISEAITDYGHGYAEFLQNGGTNTTYKAVDG